MLTWILLLLVIMPIPWVAQWIWPHNVKFGEIAIITAISAVLTLGVYTAGRYAMVVDYEMLNGTITHKGRQHDQYERTYDCNCRSVCTGTGASQICQNKCDTCYERHYTVKWFVDTTVKQITVDAMDSTSSRVYQEPDPYRFTDIKIGDPVTVPHRYTNYIKAAPDSLFHASSNTVGMFTDKIPEYPNRIYDLYKLTRVISMGVSIPEIHLWNNDVSRYVGKVGPTKQVNLIIVFVNTADSNYIHSLAGKWIGGKKNDVIVAVGMPTYPRIEWVRVLAWTDNEEFKVRMVTDLEALGSLDRTAFMNVIKHNIDTLYKRKPMSDFKYLEYSFDPPWWVVVISLLVGILSAGGTTYYFYTQASHTTIQYRRRKL
jgi:hypothetical protein